MNPLFYYGLSLDPANVFIECTPVMQETYQNYPAGYVPALEHHAAMLERTLNERYTGAAPDHLDSVRTQYLGPNMTNAPGQSGNTIPQSYEFQSGTSPDAERSWQWQVPQTPDVFGRHLDAPLLDGDIGQSHSSPPDLTVQALSATPLIAPILPVQPVARHEGMDEIPTATAASFFQTYFQFIHPQYPFLSIKDCGDWYTEWKMAPANCPISGWSAFFVKMVCNIPRPTLQTADILKIFAIGSLIQSKSDNAPRYQHQDLKSQAQSEDAIIRSTKSLPLVRLQAMLLSAMHALHSESTARIAHISGAIIRFASLHGFHHIVDMGDDESQMKTKVWSCAYM